MADRHSSGSGGPGSTDYDLLDRLAEEFARRYRQGEQPSLEEYTERYPALAEAIRGLFPALVRIEQAEGDLQGQAEWAGAARSAPPLLHQVGDFEIIRQIGRGGMGVVYEAEQVSLGRRVALKVLARRAPGDQTALERFRREARSAAGLHHTNIVPVFEVGHEGDVVYYAMQFIRGQGLDRVIIELRRIRDQQRKDAETGLRTETVAPSGDDGPSVPWASCGAEPAHQVARSLLTGRFDPGGASCEEPGSVSAPVPSRTAITALAATETLPLQVVSAAGDGVARPRPVAPAGPGSSAVLPGGTPLSGSGPGQRPYHLGVARIGQQVAEALAHAHGRGIVHRDIKPSNLLLDTAGIVWVTDFGLAKGDDEGLTQTGDVVGTIRYMAPERFRGEGDARADVYALGLTLYELLVLQPAFGSADRLQLIETIKSEEPLRPRSIDSRIPRDLETIVLKAIDKDPSRRYPSADEMAEDLQRFLDDEPIRARQVGSAERLARWCRKSPVVASLSGAVSLLLLAIIAALWSRNRSAREALEVQTALRGQADLQAKEARKAQADANLRAREAEAARVQADAARRELGDELYLSRLRLVQSAFEANQVGRGLALLDLERPRPGEPDRRGFEWHYWHRRAHGERRSVQGPVTGSDRVWLSPDGRWTVALREYMRSTGSGQSPMALAVYETDTGRKRHQFNLPPGAPADLWIGRCRVSFSQDGSRMAATWWAESTDITSATRQIARCVYELDTGKEWLKGTWTTDPAERKYFFGGLQSLALSRNGQRVAWCYNQAAKPPWLIGLIVGKFRVEVDEVTSGARLWESDLPEESVCRAVTLDPEGARLALVLESPFQRLGPDDAPGPTRLVVYEVAGGRTLLDVAGTAGECADVRFDPTGMRLAQATRTPGGGMVIQVRDAATGVIATTHRFGTAPQSFRFGPDGRALLAWPMAHGGFQVVDAISDRSPIAEGLGNAGPLASATIPADGRRVVAVLPGQGAQEWDLPDTDHPTPLSGKAYPVVATRQTTRGSDGKYLATWTGETAGGLPSNFRLGADGSRVAWTNGGFRSPLTIEDVGSGHVATSITATPITSRGFAAALGPFMLEPSGHWLASFDGQRLGFWELPAERQSASVGPETYGLYWQQNFHHASLAFAPGGAFCALPTYDERRSGGIGRAVVLLLNPETGRPIRRLEIPDEAGENVLGGRLCVSRDGRRVAYLGSDGPAVVIWDVGTGRVEQVLPLGDTRPPAERPSLRSIEFSPEGRRLAGVASPGFRGMGSRSETLLIWDLDRPSEPLRVPWGARAPLPVYPIQPGIPLCVGPDGRRLALLSGAPNERGEVKLCDWRGREMASWALDATPISAAFTPDGCRLIVALYDAKAGTARLVAFDSTPLDPAIEADELVRRFAGDLHLKADLARRVAAEPGYTPAVRREAARIANARRGDAEPLAMRGLTILGWGPATATAEQVRAALPYLEEAVRADPDHLGAQRVLGRALYLAGRFAEARAALSRGVHPAPGLAISYAYLAMSEARLGRRADAERALADYRRLWTEGHPGATSPPPLLAEAEAAIREASGARGDRTSPPPAPDRPGR